MPKRKKVEDPEEGKVLHTSPSLLEAKMPFRQLLNRAVSAGWPLSRAVAHQAYRGSEQQLLQVCILSRSTCIATTAYSHRPGAACIRSCTMKQVALHAICMTEIVDRKCMHACRWIQNQHANHRSEFWRNGLEEYLRYGKDIEAKYPVSSDAAGTSLAVPALAGEAVQRHHYHPCMIP